MRSDYEWRITMVDVADGEFMLRRLEGKPVTIRQIEKEFKLEKEALATYRANHYSRNGGLRWLQKKK